MNVKKYEDQRFAHGEHCTFRKEEEIMLNLLTTRYPENRGKIKIIDLGCGSGLVTKHLLDAGYAVKGYDISNTAVKKAVKLGIKAQIADLEDKIPEKTNSVDVIWAGDIIEHVFDPIGLLRECFRVLKPRGMTLISIPSDVGLISRLLILLGNSYQQPMYENSGYYKHHTFFTESLIRLMLSKARFHSIQVKKILSFGKYQLANDLLPSLLFNEMVICAVK